MGFRNPSAVFQIPIPTIPDSRRKKFPDSEFHKHKFPWFLYWGWSDRSPGDRSTGLLEIPVFKTHLLYRPPPIWQNFLLHGRVEWDKGGRERRLVLPINFLIVLCRLSVRIQLTKWWIFFIYKICNNSMILIKYQSTKIILKTTPWKFGNFAAIQLFSSEWC